VRVARTRAPGEPAVAASTGPLTGVRRAVAGRPRHPLLRPLLAAEARVLSLKRLRRPLSSPRPQAAAAAAAAAAAPDRPTVDARRRMPAQRSADAAAAAAAAMTPDVRSRDLRTRAEPWIRVTGPSRHGRSRRRLAEAREHVLDAVLHLAHAGPQALNPAQDSEVRVVAVDRGP
jgi:hypothetical protein